MDTRVEVLVWLVVIVVLTYEYFNAEQRGRKEAQRAYQSAIRTWMEPGHADALIACAETVLQQGENPLQNPPWTKPTSIVGTRYGKDSEMTGIPYLKGRS